MVNLSVFKLFKHDFQLTKCGDGNRERNGKVQQSNQNMDENEKCLDVMMETT
jgi:hypothetical protein